MTSVDLEDPELDVRRMVHILANLFVEEQLLEDEFAKARDKVRAQIMLMFNEEEPDYAAFSDYDYTEGSHNDVSHSSLPALTEQTEGGYVGLDPPLN